MDKIDKTKSWKKFESIIILFIFIILFGVLANISLSVPIHRWGDGSTYYMQISSITEDHDIQYQPIDIQRALLNRFDDLPAGLFLIKTDDGNYFYGKEFSYALFASPFFALLGNHGILFFNALMFWLMILMGFFYLRKKGNSPILSFFISLIFFILSTAFVYIIWIHAEIYNMFLITGGIFFWSLYIEDNKDKYLIIAAFIFGLATVAKLPNCLIFLPFLCYELYNRQFKRVISILLIFLIPIILFYGFFYLETGSMSFYGGNRLYYSNQYPFIGDFDHVHESGQPAFSIEEGRISALINSDFLTKSPVNLFYYFFGKFTGMIWYYPLTGFALLSFVLGMVYIKKQNSENYTKISIIKKNPIQYLIFIGLILNILFYVVIIGNNYLGGQHAVGNRYFYIFPAFLFLIGKIDLKVIIPFIIISLFTVIPIISDTIGISVYPEIHTYEFPYTIFPIEYSQINNLPIWIHQYTFPKYTIYDIGGHFSFKKNVIIINGTSHWLIKTKTKNQNLTLMIFAADGSNKRVAITSESHLTSTIIDGTNAEIVNIPLNQAVYEDAEYLLYSIKIESSPDVFIKPFTNPD
jgi:hypothetical protein